MAETTKAAALKRATGTVTEDPKAKLRAQFEGVEVTRDLSLKDEPGVKVGVLVDVYPVVHGADTPELTRGQVALVSKAVADRGEGFGGLVRL